MNFKNRFRTLGLGLESETPSGAVATAPVTDEQIFETMDIAEDDDRSIEDLNISVNQADAVEIEGTGETAEIVQSLSDSDRAEVIQEAALARLEANEAQATVEQLQATLENLKNIRLLVTSMADRKVSIESAGLNYLNVGLKRHASRLGLESLQLRTAALESDAAEVPADSVDVSEVDAAIAQVEEVLPQAEAAAAEADTKAEAAEAALPQATADAVEVPADAVEVGVESLTDAEDKPVAEEAESIEPEVLVEAQFDSEAEHLSKTVYEESDEILEDRDAIGEVREITEKANAADGLSVESMAALHLTMEGIHCSPSSKEIDLTPGIESYVPGQRYYPSLERITNNEEEKAGAFLTFAKNYISNLLRSFDLRADRYLHARNYMTALLARAQTSRGRPDPNARMLINIRSKHLHNSGTIPNTSAEMTSFLTSFFSTSQALQARWHAEAGKSLERTIALLNNNLRPGMSSEEIEKAMETITAGIKDARDGLGSDFRKEIPGGRLWAVDRPNAKHHSLKDHPRYKRLVDLGLRNIPVAAPFNRNGTMDPKQPAPALTPEQVKKISMEAVTALSAWNWKNGFREIASAFNLAMLVRTLIWRRRMGRLGQYAGYSSQETIEAARLIRTVLEVQSRLRFNVAFDAVGETARVCSAFYGYGNKSLKLIGSVSMEARKDKAEASDLIAVGSLVISGKQAVKVIKIHKKDFEFQGRAYKASPEAPKYVVENTKTKKRAVKSGAGLKTA